MFVRVDVTREEDWTGAVEQTVARFGKLNVLVNNAGISGLGYPDTTSLEGWDRIMDINSKGVFLGTRSAIPKMQEAGGGSIINISSIMGMVGSDLGHPAYNASKGAVRLFTKAMAVRHGRDGIRVNSVHPGFMPSMPSGVMPTPAAREALISAVPLGRAGLYEDVATAVLFLASDEASYITGTELVVDGGFIAR
jgi:NAD(P)-dependent dehydrogenase (short-subunit alcohol dehydrogenase family)